MKNILFFRAALLFLSGLCFNAAIQAQNFNLIDIDKIKNSFPTNNEFSAKNTFAYLDGFFYFTADDGIHGTELWKSNGTAAGTKLVKDVNPGTVSSNLNYSHDITISGGKIYFSAGDNTTGDELWVSDGTEAGTQLLADIATGNQSSNPQFLTDINGTLFFFVSYFDNIIFNSFNQLWKSDGTPAGTVLVNDFTNYGFSLQQMVNVNGRAFFTFYNFNTGQELYTSDGTSIGTYMVADINLFGNSLPSHLTPSNGLLYFAADDGNGGKLWVTDGSPEGTHAVNNTNNINVPVNGGSYEDTFAIWNNVLYFQGFTPTEGNELCKYDPTAAEPNVTRVKDIIPGENSSYPSFITNAGDKLFFTIGPAGADAQLWKSDGTEEGTVLVKDINPGGNNYYYGLTNVEGNILYAYGNNALGTELWKSDGTDAGTVLVKEIFPGVNSSYPGYFTYENGVFIFSANDGTKGYELWRSDGTTAGTKLIKNINQTSTSGSYPYAFAATTDSKTVFVASDEKNGGGLWVTDGSNAGTKLLKGNLSPAALTKFQNNTYFISYDNSGVNLWKTNGTSAGTTLVPTPDLVDEQSQYIPTLIATDNLLYIVVINFYTGYTILWRTDGTEIGTFIVKSDLPYFYNLNFTAVGNNLFFTNYDDLNGQELWKSDGSVAGTGLVKDIFPGFNGSYPTNLFNFNGKLYLSAYDASGLPGNSLWTSDGTEAGTKQVKPVLVGYIPFARANGKFFFYAENLVSKGYELFSSDGTKAGTKLLKDIFPGPASSNINSLISGDTLVFFLADDGTHGQELWKSNGTKTGTKLVKELSPGIFPFYLNYAVGGNNKLFFLIGDTLWQSDGTKKGTNPVDDVNLEGVTNKYNLASVNGYIYFSGYNYASGQELYAGSIDGAFSTVQPTAISLAKPALPGLIDSEEFAVKLLSNPVKDELQFTVNVKKQQVAQIMIIDVTGRKLAADKQLLSTGSNKFSYNTMSWAPGLYLVSIRTTENFCDLLKAVK